MRRRLQLLLGLLVAVATLSPTSAAARRWSLLELDGHRIWFRTKDAAFAAAVSRTVRELTPAIAARYRFRPPDTTNWVLYDDVEWFNGAAYTLSNRIELWGTSADFELRGHHPWLPNVVSHEYGHLATLSLARRYPRWIGGLSLGGVEQFARRNGRLGAATVGFSMLVPGERVPRWFSEGIAQYDAEANGADGWDSTRRMLERTAWLARRTMSIGEMGSVADKSWFEAEQVYNQGYSFVRWLAETFGSESLYALLVTESEQTFGGFTRTLERAYGQPIRVLENGWHAAIAARVEADLAALPTRTPVTTATFFADGPFVRHASVSPDGRLLAFVDDGETDYPRNRLVVAPVGAPSQQTTSASGVPERPTWHPSGATIYVSRTRKLHYPDRETWDLARIDPANGRDKWLTKGQRLRWPDVHPSGLTIAASRRGPGSWDLAFVDPATGVVRPLTQLPWGWQLREPRWLDDRTLVAVLARGDEVDLIRLKPDSPGQATRLVWPGSEERDPAIAEDGSVWFSSDRGGIWQLHRWTTTGTIEQYTAVSTAAREPLPLTDRVLFTRYDHHRFLLAQIPVSAAALWTTAAVTDVVHLPRADTVALPTARPARFRPGRLLVYPQLRYAFGYPLGGALFYFEDALGHHSLELDTLFGRRVESEPGPRPQIGLTWRYDGLPPRLEAGYAHRFSNINAGGFLLPLAWHDLWGRVLYGLNRKTIVGATWRFDHIDYQDEIELLGLGDQIGRIRRHMAGLLLQWSTLGRHSRDDIDPRGATIYGTWDVGRSRARPFAVDASGALTANLDRYWFNRGWIDAGWSKGWGWFTGELQGQAGWIDRDVDTIDELYLGGNIFSNFGGEVQTFFQGLSGYDEFAVAGEKLLLLRAASRFQLATDMGATGPILFDALVLQIAGELGNAWPDALRWRTIIRRWFRGDGIADAPRPFDPTLGIAANDQRFIGLLPNLSAELRLKTILFDFMPWNSFIRAAWGPRDRTLDTTTGAFQRTSDLPVRIYVGVGTGF